ncbi:MAG TPA: T9SS type A sorting domain-containing protein, partial [Chitinophagales bacterium]|nr:T9SS type A sorting domain-containing protein [Chitinophagales bacterium]
CYANSDSVVITVFEQPTAPNIIVIGNTLTTSSTWDVQWYYNGDPIPGATSTSYTPAIEGLYQVAAVNGPCMAYSVEVDFVFQSVNEVFMPSLQITPNPNEGQFICDFSVTELQDIQIRVTNMLGEVVYSNELHNIIGNNQFAIDLTPADTGIYLLDIQSSKGHIIRKIVVQ